MTNRKGLPSGFITNTDLFSDLQLKAWSNWKKTIVVRATLRALASGTPLAYSSININNVPTP